MKNKDIIPILLGFVTLILIFIVSAILNGNIQTKTKLDLPEEYSLANDNDTLIAIKKGNTLHIQFNNK